MFDWLSPGFTNSGAPSDPFMALLYPACAHDPLQNEIESSSVWPQKRKNVSTDSFSFHKEEEYFMTAREN
jgi:hypothetical protein